MDPVAIGSLIGVSVGAALTMFLQKKRNSEMAAKIEPTLRARGPLTLIELATALDMRSFFARGKVVMALGDLVNQGKVQTIPAPEGTPQLKKVNFIKYQLRG